MTAASDDWEPRLTEIARSLEEMIGGDLGLELPLSPAQDIVDAVAYGVNILVSELAFMTADLKRAKATAENANRAKTRFLRNASHELRTPLAVVVWLAEMLDDPTRLPPEKIAQYVDGIRRNARELLRLIEALLDLSRIEADQLELTLEPIDLPGALEELVDSLRPLAEPKGILLGIAMGLDAPSTIVTDRLRLRQILVNLVQNAIKFTARGEITLRVQQLGARVAIDVEDSGVGIEPAAHGAIFDPFFQVEGATTPRHVGTGLGLGLSKELAERLSGALELRSSAPGRGSVFRLTLPLDLPQGLHSSAREAPPRSFEGRPLDGIRVLIADDDDELREILAIFLMEAGGKVSLAQNGAEAVEKALTNEIDIVLMDIRMPVLDGLSAAVKLRFFGFDRPIVAISASGAAGQPEECLAAGCDAHISKPVAAHELVATMQATLRACASRLQEQSGSG